MGNPLAGRARRRSVRKCAGCHRTGPAHAAEDASASATTSRRSPAYYRDFSSRPERSRQESRSKAYEALAAKYPDDDEAQIFSALYIAGTQTQADQTYAAYLKAAAILEKQFVKYPDHPGVAHYLIHSYDAPPIAEKGLSAARRYADIAPAAPHALHMPSHIFTRVGEWEASAATNLRSIDAARKAGERPEAYHASDYAVYAYLQLGRDADAKRTIDDAFKVNFAVEGAPGSTRGPRCPRAMRWSAETGARRCSSAPATTACLPGSEHVLRTSASGPRAAGT